MVKIAIFASGNGTNAENIAKYFADKPYAEVALILSNSPDAKVLQRAKALGIKTYTFGKKELYETFSVIDILTQNAIDLIVLAGFLWLIPEELISLYRGKILNIHPALLPKYGGKGMYGMNVHKAVISNKESQSGITIHLVDEKYDNGQIIFQATCQVEPDDTAESLAEKVHQLEYKFYPMIIEQFAKNLLNQNL